MTLFWIIAGAAALVVTTLLVLALMRGRRETGPAEAYDLKVYRDQLREIDRDATRGTIPPEEADRLRTEVSRRILAADAKLQGDAAAGTQGRTSSGIMAGLIALVLFGGAFGLYLTLGAPGYGDLGLQDRIAAARDMRANRPSQAEVEAQVPAQPPTDAPDDYLSLVERLRTAVTERPDDLQGHILLARSEAALGNYPAAYAAQRKLIELKGDAATAKDYADLADMLVLAAGGYVSPEAERIIDEVMARDPSNGVARYYGGLMMAQTGRPDAGFRIWDTLLRESAPSDPWVAPIRDQIPDLARAAGVNDYALPEALTSPSAPPLAGPDAADVEAASEMSDADRQQMIQGMVERLGNRLATEGGSPQEWAQLLGALGVLGETDRAREIWTEAQGVFEGNAEALAVVRGGAERAGVAE
ncbi:MAG: c-type cytochrome biogenesis protein CcmI [Rhodobacteraceae bacterium]|jgi:cytochrome c-type biogenesis protein CcmH|uniref:c-type cytochrome biogenesis protein CcmI n=1 Tax=Salipiger profundus TaxID=1229727 RepID=UPI0008E17EFF|nr:c-type cytochrome biogenesis protein CcmI [Salipiger profundus]MAB06746.1 c-type cytochrome biogenesis protein CcmI [Paracoccaceae bacterium]SFB96362.1 cytochrome c-type biogenesis protein CcmH [Salipiger profundus]